MTFLGDKRTWSDFLRLLWADGASCEKNRDLTNRRMVSDWFKRIYIYIGYTYIVFVYIYILSVICDTCFKKYLTAWRWTYLFWHAHMFGLKAPTCDCWLTLKDSEYWVHPGKLTFWTQKMEVWKMNSRWTSRQFSRVYFQTLMNVLCLARASWITSGLSVLFSSNRSTISL